MFGKFKLASKASEYSQSTTSSPGEKKSDQSSKANQTTVQPHTPSPKVPATPATPDDTRPSKHPDILRIELSIMRAEAKMHEKSVELYRLQQVQENSPIETEEIAAKINALERELDDMEGEVSRKHRAMRQIGGYWQRRHNEAVARKKEAEEEFHDAPETQ